MYPKKIALIDVGTLKVKSELREYTTPHDFSVLYRVSERTALGRDWDKQGNCIGSEACHATIDAIKGARAHMATLGTHEVRLVGTEALRRANNSATILREIEVHTGIPLTLISQEDEAQLFFSAVASDFSTCIAALDVGGGSAQVAIGHAGEVPECFLFPTGTYGVRTTFIDEHKPTQEGFLSARAHIYDALRPLQDTRLQPTGVVLGSTIVLDFFRTILPQFDLVGKTTTRNTHPLVLDVDTLTTILERIALLPHKEREALFAPEPAYTWGVDVTILHALAVCEYLGVNEVYPTNHNVSSGLFACAVHT